MVKFLAYSEFLVQIGVLSSNWMKEAGYYFYMLMFGMFQSNRFVANRVDPCVIHRFEFDWEVHGAISVDDCFFAVSSPDFMKAL
jgi:hypothetical protein